MSQEEFWTLNLGEQGKWVSPSLFLPLLPATQNCQTLQPPASVAMFCRLDIWKARLSFQIPTEMWSALQPETQAIKNCSTAMYYKQGYLSRLTHYIALQAPSIWEIKLANGLIGDLGAFYLTYKYFYLIYFFQWHRFISKGVHPSLSPFFLPIIPFYYHSSIVIHFTVTCLAFLDIHAMHWQV